MRNQHFVGAFCNMPAYKKHYRRSIRLKGHDYSWEGTYFVTICTHNRECLFGDLLDGRTQLNEYGVIAKNEWLKTPQMRNNVIIDEFIVMPNHLHGIIIITGDGGGTVHRAPTVEQFGKPVSGSLPTIIRSFKSTVTNQINLLRNTPGTPVWQRNYYEHIIRNEDELHHIQEYIINNPFQWQFDRENPGRITDNSYENRWRHLKEVLYAENKK